MSFFYSKKTQNGRTKKKILGGLIKKIKTAEKKEIFVFGVRVYKEKLKTTKNELNIVVGPNNIIHYSGYTISNAGDTILVKSLKKTVDVVSKENNVYIDKHIHNIVTENEIGSINRSKGIIVGGGGLFLKDTNPNEISGWQWSCSSEMLNKINSPLFILGVGYNRFRGQEDFGDIFKENINTLVRKASFFGLRNYGSIKAIQSYLDDELKSKVKFHPCATTVLSKLYTIPTRTEEEPFIAVNCAFDRIDKRLGSSGEEILKKIARVIKKLSINYTIKYYVHVETDMNILPFFDELEINYIIVKLNGELTEDDFMKIYSTPSLAIGMRGHAQMVPFGCQTPILSIVSHDKMQWFLDDINHPEWGVDIQDENFETNLFNQAVYILGNKQKIQKELIDAQNILWEVIQDNLKYCNEIIHAHQENKLKISLRERERERERERPQRL